MASQYLIPGGGSVCDLATGKQYMLPGVGVLNSTGVATDTFPYGIAVETDTALALTLASNVMRCAHRTTGMAELGVQFSVNVGIAAGDSIPIHEVSECVDRVLYIWDFGDANEFVPDGNLNIGFGPNVSHLYKQAGTYVVTLHTIEAGTTISFSQTITVSAWSGGTTYYVDSQLGNDANAGTSAGAGAWATSTKVNQHLIALGAATQAQYLFTAVDSLGAQMVFQHNAAGGIGTRTAPVRIGVYDPGSTGIKPRIVCNTDDGWLSLAAATDDVRCVGLHVRGNGATVNNQAMRPGKNTLLYNCLLDNFNTTISTSKAHGNKEYFLMQQSRVINAYGYGVFFDFGRYNAVIAVVVDGVSQTNGEHPMRLYWDKSYMAYCELIAGSQNNKHSLKWVGITDVNDSARNPVIPASIEHSTYCTIWRNRAHSTVVGQNWLMAFSAVNAEGSREYSTQLMVWENKVAMGGNAQVAYYINWGFNSYINNVADLTGSSATSRAGFRVTQRGDDVAPDDNHLYHNTTFCNGGSGTVRGIQISVSPPPATLTPDGNNCRNNLLNLVSGGSQDGTDGIADSGTNTTKTPNLYTTSATCLEAPGGIDGDYRPRDGGAAVNGVTRINEAWLPSAWTLTMTARPSGAGNADYGAYEFVSAGVVIPEPEPVVASTGVNLDKLKFDGTAIMFTDVMRQSGWPTGTSGTGVSPFYPWRARNASDFGVNNTLVTDMVNATGHCDVTIPFNDGSNGDAILETKMLNVSSGSYPTGAYTVTFSGAGTITISGDATATITSSGQTFTVTTPSSSGITLRITACDIGTPIQNIRVKMPGYTGDEPFYPPFITRLQSFARQSPQAARTVLRTFELSRTNGKRDTNNDPNVVLWADRTTTSWSSQATSNGVAWEYIFDLCNEVGGDCWISVHHQANSAYRTSLATLALSDLTSTLRCFIEWSNEASWNGSFDQCTHARTQGNAAGFTGSTAQKGRKYYCKQAASMFDEFLAVWGNSANRIIKVLASQASSTTVTSEIFDYFEETSIDSVNVNPNLRKVNALAIAPYFGLHTSTGDKFADDIVDDGTYLTQPLTQLIDRIEASYMPLAITNMTNQKSSVNTFAAISSKPYTGCQLICYEGGANLTADVSANQSNSTLTTVLKNIQRHELFYDTCLYYLDQWEKLGGALFCWFHFCDDWESGADMYGSMESLDQDTSIAAKFRAVRDFNAGIRPAPGGGGTPGGALPTRPRWKQFNQFSSFRAFDGRTPVVP